MLFFNGFLIDIDLKLFNETDQKEFNYHCAISSSFFH